MHLKAAPQASQCALWHGAPYSHRILLAGLKCLSEKKRLIDDWMGHENRDMGTRYAKQLIENIE